MMRSLFSGVSGLKNHQTRMDVIGNNISNVNTTGFKSSRVNFTDMLSQTLSGASTPQGNTVGGTNPKQIGLGSSVGAVDLLFTNGSVQSTGVNTDLALSSTNALFILKTSTGGQVFTRNGDFQFDANGNYVQAGNGYFVQGWMADDDGTIKGGDVTNIQIPSGKQMKAKMTSKVNFSNNLDAAVPAKTATHEGGQCVITTTVYSALGDPITVTMVATRGEITQTTDDPPDNISNWTLSNFKATTTDLNGNPVEVEIVEPQTVNLKFDGYGKIASDEDVSNVFKLTYETSSGAHEVQPIAMNFKELTQYTTGTGSTVAATRADGNASGTLQSISIDKSGVITGTYTNGEKKAEAQVALMRFNNPGGLTKVGESLYEDSNNAGRDETPKTAAALGATITPAALEMSNVDVANEFTDMIITQRGFQGNSKIITVSDEMLETLINMKR